jgi:hypothetical protein
MQATTTEAIYGFAEMFSVPEFVKDMDIRETWMELLRWILLRQSAVDLETPLSLRTAEVDETLLTLRIYKISDSG